MVIERIRVTMDNFRGGDTYMDHSNTISYIRNILDKNLPDVRVLLKEVRKIGESI